MSGTIDNGQRLEVAFGSYTGLAGVVERDGVTQVAFRARTRDLSGVKEGTVDGQPHCVLSIASSLHTSGMVVLEVEPLPGTAVTAD